MNPIETLMSEHRLIEQVLGALETYAAQLKAGEVAERGELVEFTTFIREFADAAHHGKEEDLLFEAMVQNGFPREAGPIGVMLHEHTQGRQLVAAMRELGEKPGPWTAEERQAAVSAAVAYSGLLRQHIAKEDRILYPMAESHLAEEEMLGLAGAFDAFDAKHAEIEERMAKLAEGLIARWAEGRRPAEETPTSRPAPARSNCSVCSGE